VRVEVAVVLRHAVVCVVVLVVLVALWLREEGGEEEEEEEAPHPQDDPLSHPPSHIQSTRETQTA
jgi:hypothetical protein